MKERRVERLGEDWKARAIAVGAIVIADWRERPTGKHTQEDCEFCMEFGCRRCPIWIVGGVHCERDVNHMAWQKAYVQDDASGMLQAAARIVVDLCRGKRRLEEV